LVWLANILFAEARTVTPSLRSRATCSNTDGERDYGDRDARLGSFVIWISLSAARAASTRSSQRDPAAC